VGLVDEIEEVDEQVKMDSFLLRLASITEIPLVKAERLVRNMLLRDGVDEAFTKTRWGWVTLGLTIQNPPMDLWKMEYRPKPAGLNQPWPEPPTPKSVFQQMLTYVEMTVDMHAVPLREGYYRWMVFIPREDAPAKFLAWQEYCQKVMAEIVAKHWYRNYVIDAAPPEPSDEWKPEQWMSPKPEVHLTQERSARVLGLLPPEPKPATVGETWKQRKAELERTREAWNAVKRQNWPVRLAVDNSRKDEE
jgi:hypothetical protein